MSTIRLNVFGIFMACLLIPSMSRTVQLRYHSSPVTALLESGSVNTTQDIEMMVLWRKLLGPDISEGYAIGAVIPLFRTVLSEFYSNDHDAYESTTAILGGVPIASQPLGDSTSPASPY
ncbi:hypothetical protein BJV78DRAFT_1283138 [Lactifluus subvellereus]|nr:hypothetical protein BJV78DRAFT_1283138 [Lactifluus subvellereus]